LKVPAGHDVQTLLPPPGPVVPALHMHAAADVLFAAEMELAGHNEHSPSPENCLYFPEVQATQDAAGVGRVQPGLHLQSVAWSLPAGAVVSCGHTTHTVASNAATAAEYLSDGHREHGASPDSLLNFPAEHAVHFSPLKPENPLSQRQSV